MSYTLVLNSSNVMANGRNTNFEYKFISGSLVIPENSEMAISNVTIPYSFFNINLQLYNNSSFSYTFPSSTGTNTYSVTLPDGYYSVDDINQYLQTVMITNGQYLVNASGQYVYYITLAYDVVYYSVQLVCYAVPTSLPTGYTNSAGMTFPSAATTPQLIISDNNFGAVIGFTTGTYPSTASTSNQSTLSNTVPDGSVVNSMILRCNLVDNCVTMPSDIVDSIPISNTVFGANISYQPSFAKWQKVKAGRYSSMRVSIVDQNLNAIQANDPNVLITLLLKIGSNINNSGK